MIDNEKLRNNFQKALASHKKLEVYTSANAPSSELAKQGRKRGLPSDASVPKFYLYCTDGVMHWAKQPAPVVSGLRRGLQRGLTPRNFIGKILAAPLEANMVASFLRDLDETWNKHQGLKRWDGTQLKPIEKKNIDRTARTLLLIHGTFSNAAAMTNPMQDQQFLDAAGKKYQQILAFDHPSVSVSPVINAIDLSRFLDEFDADIDVIAHSRGGLVARWWLETLDRGKGKRRVVLVGCPMDGTSLATPRSIRSLMDWLSSLSSVIGELSGAASAVLPFMTVVSGLARLSSTVTNVVSKAPIADAAISMVPGLSAMARENFELERSQVVSARAPEYFAITSDFEPDAVGWEFWKAFQGPPTKIRAANALVDPLFARANDLVVDTPSMSFLTSTLEIHAKNVKPFGKNAKVYHTNYFEQKETLDWIKDKLQI